MKKRRILLMLLVVILIVSPIYFFLGKSTNAQTSDLRPKYCIDEKCINPDIFSDLPKYPSNFDEVWVLLYPNVKLGFLEQFSSKYPDEYYWKQPEFYADDFRSDGIKFYTIKNIMFEAGSGMYPADIIVSNITINQTFPVVTYWHSGWSIPKYQFFKLNPSFPENAVIRMGSYSVSQDPQQAQSCIKIDLYPSNLFLSPTYPKFYYDWTQKVTANITVMCSGKWAVFVSPSDPDPVAFQNIIREIGAYHVSQIPQGGTWQIFLEVNG
jgi:hypothetical protein